MFGGRVPNHPWLSLLSLFFSLRALINPALCIVHRERLEGCAHSRWVRSIAEFRPPHLTYWLEFRWSQAIWTIPIARFLPISSHAVDCFGYWKSLNNPVWSDSRESEKTVYCWAGSRVGIRAWWGIQNFFECMSTCYYTHPKSILRFMSL